MRTRWTLLSVLVAVLIVTGTDAAAQLSGRPDGIVFWSSQGPVAVERISAADAGPIEPETLLRELLEGPTAQEVGKGLWTAIPQGTTLLDVREETGETLIVRLDVPLQALQSLQHESFEIVVNQIGHTLIPFNWRDLRIQARDPESGTFVALAEFLPPVPVPLKPSVAAGGRESADRQITPPQPAAPGQGQPRGALSGKSVYVSAGHGWQWVYSYSAGAERWKTQRPPYPASSAYYGPVIEDHNNAEAVNQYLLRYLWNAGAMVWPVRERDMNAAEAIVDDSSTGFSASASGWTAATGGYAGHHHEARTVTGQPTATAHWSASLPSAGRYAVYVWFRADSNAPADAEYTVHHAGGETRVSVDQRRHGHTWHYIGTYGFLAGQDKRVSLTNQSSLAGQTIVADAVRLGGGTFDDLTGIDTGANVPAHKPWWEVASYYYTQRMGMEAAYGDVTARPVYARWEHAGTGEDAVYVSWHTNGFSGYQSDYSGTETYAHNGEGLPRTEGSLQLRQAIHTEVVHDIRAGWDATWVDRGEKQRNLGELRLLWDDDPSRRMPGALIEIAFHDHPGDTNSLKEPTFNRLVARAIYQGIAKYFDPGAPLLPEPPTDLAVENAGGGRIRVSWAPPAMDSRGLAGDPPTGYRVYTSRNGIGWSDGVAAPSGTTVVLSGYPADELVFVRVTATNAGGESFPTETLGARVGDAADLLLVNGFDRLNRTMVLHEDDPEEGLNARMLVERMNSYDYVLQHGKAIREAGSYALDSASNEAVQSGRINLSNYTVVDWILGEESVDDSTLNSAERSLLRSFLSGGGALFISGSEIGYHLDWAGADPGFYNDLLRADYAGDDAGTYQVWGTSGPFAGLSFRFDAPGMYDADYPDQLRPFGGSQEVLRYQGGAGGTAALQYANGCQRVVTFGFPFETIQADQRSAVMSAVMGFLDECIQRTVNTVIDSPAYGSTHAAPPAFNGTSNAEQALPDRVEITIQQSSTGHYWNGTGWVPGETWLTASGAESWSYSLPSPLPDGDYQLRARAYAGGVLDTSPAQVVFTHDGTPPPATSLIAPTGGVSITALPELLLDWVDVGPDGGSDISYQVELDGERRTATSSFYTTKDVADGSHAWRVRVHDAAGNESAWTPVETFSVSRLHSWLPVVLREHTGSLSSCSNVLTNGGFELDAAWVPNPESYTPYSTAEAHSGLRSGIVGYDNKTYSSVRQQVEVPAGSRATLRLWLYPISEGNDPEDWHYVSLWDEEGRRHNLELTTSDARAWRPAEYDVSDFMGQRLTIIVGAVNDGDGNLTRAYVDDVELAVCP